jgi:lysophospholipase L1-like esterase
LTSAIRGVRRAWLPAILLALWPARSPALEPGDRVAVCGDSITEQRVYTVFIEDYLLKCQPVRVGSVQQIGWSGEALPGLLGRIGSDVLPFHPTVVTTLYGMNDGGYKPTRPDTVAAFRKNTASAIRAFKAAGARLVVVGSPGAVDTDRFKTWFAAGCSPDAYNQTLYDLGQAARAAAGQEGAEWVDVHGAMMDAMARAKAKYGPDYFIAPDGVHPAPNGQLVMAYAFLRAMGCSGRIGTITIDAASGEATASGGHRIIASSPGRTEVESERYPFCFTDDPAYPESTRSILSCLAFNADLNRFILVVTHAPSRMKVSWGGVSRAYSADELARGVNLAGDFLENPFSQAFARVHVLVAAQQAYETPAVKGLLNGMGATRRYFPERQGAFDDMQAAVLQKDTQLFGDCRAAVLPVRHVIELAAAPAP